MLASSSRGELTHVKVCARRTHSVIWIKSSSAGYGSIISVICADMKDA